MPIILSMVTNDFTESQAKKIRRKIRQALEGEGIMPEDVTVEYFHGVFPERLIIYYDSGSVLLKRAGERREHADIVAGIIHDILGFPVECRVMRLKEYGICLLP